jgi:hypothetical protein
MYGKSFAISHIHLDDVSHEHNINRPFFFFFFRSSIHGVCGARRKSESNVVNSCGEVLEASQCDGGKQQHQRNDVVN